MNLAVGTSMTEFILRLYYVLKTSKTTLTIIKIVIQEQLF